MEFTLLAANTLPLRPQLQWQWFSNRTSSFIAGDDQKAFALAVSNPAVAAPLFAARGYDDRVPPAHPCNLPIPMPLYEELADDPWHGFHFLEPGANDRATDGDLLRTLIFGPNYGHYLLHPKSGLVLSLRSGSMELLERTPAGFKSLGKTRTRGSSVLAFAGHPEEALIVYGDNSGKFHAHRFDASGFGKASKIADKQRKASRLEFAQAGKMLVIGGMGYLSTFAYTSGKFEPLHEAAISVKDFACADDGKLMLVNQGLHGVSACRYDQNGFTKVGTLEIPGAVKEMTVSKCWRYMAVSMQDSAVVRVYEIRVD